MMLNITYVSDTQRLLELHLMALFDKLCTISIDIQHLLRVGPPTHHQRMEYPPQKGGQLHFGANT